MKGFIRRGAGAWLTLTLLAAGMASSPARAGAVVAPPLPAAQPSPSGETCTPQAPAARWTQVYSETDAQPPSFQLTVDPAEPCRIYRATTAQAVDRSLDGGRTWQPAFRDDARLTATTSAFTASGLDAVDGGGVVMAERGNGDAVVVSGDAGRSWQLADAGLEMQPVRDVTTAPDFVPLRSGVAYATVSGQACAAAPGASLPGGSDTGCGGEAPSAGVAGLFVTTDGGQSWTPATLPSLPALTGSASTECAPPCDERVQIQVDPAHPEHLWMLLSPTGNEGPSAQSVATGQPPLLPPSAIVESSDHGRTWSVVSTFPAPLYVSQILVTRTGRHGLRLYAVEPGVTPSILVFANGAAPFTTIQATLGPGAVLAADPADGDRMVYVGAVPLNGRLQVIDLFSFDGLDTFSLNAGPAALTAATLEVNTPLAPAVLQPSGDPRAVVQADERGNFYIAAVQRCDDPRCTSTRSGAGAWWRQSYWRLDPGVPGPRQVQSCATAGACPTSTSTLLMTQLLACPVPADINGSIAYDGHEVLYTRYRETGLTQNQALVHLVDPLTCVDTPMLVDFSPADLAAAEAVSGCQLSPPTVDDMTYDQRRNVIWASLRDNSNPFNPFDPCSSHGPYLFTMEVTDRSTVPVRGRGRLGLLAGCDQSLSYDVSDDTVWSCISANSSSAIGLDLGHFRARDGVVVPSCMTRMLQGGGASTYATWLATPPYLLIWDESDIYVEVVDPARCVTVRTLTHRPWAEPAAEEEQMACDPLTLAPDSPLVSRLGGALPATTVIWAKDQNGDISASVLPRGNGTCPLPTVLRLSAPATALPGAVVPLCATLTHRYPGGADPITRGVHLTDSGTTDGGRTVAENAIGWMQTTTTATLACTRWRAPADPGTYRIAARFPGDEQYLSSADVTVLRVVGTTPTPAIPQRPSVRTIATPALPPPAPPAPPAPVSDVSVVPQVQAEAQAQVEAQAQSQVQAQSNMQAQPAAMVQRRTQHQVAVQTSVMPQPSTAFATRLVPRRAVPWAAVALALGWLGTLTPAPLRPQPAWAWRRRRREGAFRRTP